MAILRGPRYLSIVGESGTVDLNRPNYWLRSIAPLLGGGDVRGHDRILPGVPGVYAESRYATFTTYSLRLVIDGEVDDDGIPEGSPATACEDTIEFLVAELMDSATSESSPERAATLQPSGRSAVVRVLGIDPDEEQDAPNVITADLRLGVVGRFT